jgi:hypothetical protein
VRGHFDPRAQFQHARIAGGRDAQQLREAFARTPQARRGRGGEFRDAGIAKSVPSATVSKPGRTAPDTSSQYAALS